MLVDILSILSNPVGGFHFQSDLPLCRLAAATAPAAPTVLAAVQRSGNSNPSILHFARCHYTSHSHVRRAARASAQAALTASANAKRDGQVVLVLGVKGTVNTAVLRLLASRPSYNWPSSAFGSLAAVQKTLTSGACSGAAFEAGRYQLPLTGRLTASSRLGSGALVCLLNRSPVLSIHGNGASSTTVQAWRGVLATHAGAPEQNEAHNCPGPITRHISWCSPAQPVIYSRDTAAAAAAAAPAALQPST